MQNLFTLLFLLSIVLLPISVFKPAIFERIMGRKPTRVQAALISVALIFVFLILTGATSDKKPDVSTEEFSQEIGSDVSNKKEAINSVSTYVPADNLLDIDTALLETKNNPNGEGVFVFYPETEFSGVERYLLWLVLDDDVYALNGATKDVTPETLWPREVEDSKWDITGLDKYEATEAINIVFGK